MPHVSPNSDPREAFNLVLKAVRDFDNAVVVTRDTSGKPNGRPMHIVTVSDGCVLQFVTDKDTSIAYEADRMAGDAVVTLQGRATHVVLTGKVDVRVDKPFVEEHWAPSWKMWFEDGPKDPDIRVVRFTAETADLWTMSASGILRFGLDALKAVFTGETADPTKWSTRVELGNVDATRANAGL